MLKEVEKNAVYYALIIIFLGFTLYLLSPALFPRPPVQSPSIIVSPSGFSTVNVTILTSSKCKALCDSRNVESLLKRSFVNLLLERIDVETAAGRRLADEHNVSLVPAYLFDASIRNSSLFPSFEQYLRPSGDGFVLASLEARSGFLFASMPSEEPSIVQFITSFDANSLAFQNTTLNILSRFNNSINYTIRYAVRFENNSFYSVNGYDEMVEAAIQRCVFETGSENALNAVACRSREIRDCLNKSSPPSFCARFWQTCITGWGFNDSDVTQCVKTRNNSILLTEANFTQEAGVMEIPTTIIGGQYRIAGNLREAELLSTICAIYPSPEGCVVRIRNN